MSGQKCVSIDLGSRYIHILESLYKTGRVEVKKAIMVNTPVGSIAEGKIEDKTTLRQVLLSTLQQNKINTRDVIFTIQSASIITRDIVLPVMKKEDLVSAVKYEMEQYLPSSISKYEIEFRVVEELTEDNVKKYKIRSAAMPVEIVDNYFNLAKEAKLNPIALDIHSNAVSKMFAKETDINGERYNTNTTVAVIDIGYKSTAINIISKGSLEFNRLVAYGGRDIDLVLASHYDLQLEKAEQKKEHEIRLDHFDSSSNNPDSIEELLKSSFGQLLSEIQKIFQYYISRNQDKKIETIYLYGGSSNIRGLPEFMRMMLNTGQVIKIKSINNVIFTESAGGANIECYINNLGAMIRL